MYFFIDYSIPYYFINSQSIYNINFRFFSDNLKNTCLRLDKDLIFDNEK